MENTDRTNEKMKDPNPTQRKFGFKTESTGRLGTNSEHFPIKYCLLHSLSLRQLSPPLVSYSLIIRFRAR